MLRFRLWRIPIEIHPSHLLVSAVFALYLLPEKAGPGWPERLVSKDGALSNLPTLLLYVGLWVGVVFVSVLVHELGHALVARAFGYSPSIQLVWLGGATNPNAAQPIPWHKDVLLTLAGPGSGLTLGLLSLASLFLFESRGYEVLNYALKFLAGANLVWAVYNMVPVMPLDGGRIASAVLQRLFGRPGFLVAQLLGLAVSVAVIAYAVAVNWLLVIIFMGTYAMRSVMLIQAYFKGEAPTPTQVHPGELAFAQCAALFGQGKFDEAVLLAARTLDTELPPSTRGRLHHLLGWVALKKGSGRSALDHFSQVPGQKVEAQALAAAFSLIGDETRALPLWELAFAESKDRTVLHEWAGSLIRAGRLDDAKRLPAVDLATAYGCAERVAFLRADFAAAALLGEAALALAPRAEIAYDAACAHAKAGDAASAVRLLEQAHGLGFTDANFAAADADLSALRGEPRFEAWLKRLREGPRA
jgi:Zn-dependent protease